jgi:AraC-like DNA-binding protein
MIYARPAIRILSSVNSFFGRVLPVVRKPSANIDWRTQKLKKFIDSNSGKVQSRLDDVCRQLDLAVSDRQARRLFRGSTGVGIKEYARRRRLICAAHQLRRTDLPIKRIAGDLGYQTAGHFTRSFKDVFRLSPVQFRKVWRREEVAALRM